MFLLFLLQDKDSCLQVFTEKCMVILSLAALLILNRLYVIPPVYLHDPRAQQSFIPCWNHIGCSFCAYLDRPKRHGRLRKHLKPLRHGSVSSCLRRAWVSDWDRNNEVEISCVHLCRFIIGFLNWPYIGCLRWTSHLWQRSQKRTTLHCIQHSDMSYLHIHIL